MNIFTYQTLHKARQRAVVLCAVVLLLVVLLSVPRRASAATLTIRTLNISSSVPSAVVTHSFSFTSPSSSSIGSIEFEYCTNDPFVGTACTAPSGMDLTTATIGSQSGEVGFGLHASTTANKLIITRVPSATTPGEWIYSFGNVINPDTPNLSTYARISTFASNDATGARTDSGSLVFSTSGSLNVTAYVPPYLRFCTGITVNDICTLVDGFYINLGELSDTQPRFSTSQFAGSTNDDTGYTVSVIGTTMTSGNNIIPALASTTASNPGTSQFGINLRDNANPDVGQNITGAGSGAAAAGYNTPNQFRFVSGETLASSPLPTDPNVYTVSYLVNVNDGQSPGTYTTTLTYIATAQF